MLACSSREKKTKRLYCWCYHTASLTDLFTSLITHIFITTPLSFQTPNLYRTAQNCDEDDDEVAADSTNGRIQNRQIVCLMWKCR